MWRCRETPSLRRASIATHVLQLSPMDIYGHRCMKVPEASGAPFKEREAGLLDDQWKLVQRRLPNIARA